MYYEDLDRDDSKKHTLNNGYTQWVAHWGIFGNFANANLKNGKYKMSFMDDQGQEIAIKGSTQYHPHMHTNNDYAPLLSTIFWGLDAQDNFVIEVKGDSDDN